MALKSREYGEMDRRVAYIAWSLWNSGDDWAARVLLRCVDNDHLSQSDERRVAKLREIRKGIKI